MSQRPPSPRTPFPLLVLFNLSQFGHICRAEAEVDMIRQGRIMLCAEFVETPTFTRLIGKLMDDDLSHDEIKQLKRLVDEFEL